MTQLTKRYFFIIKQWMEVNSTKLNKIETLVLTNIGIIAATNGVIIIINNFL